MINDLYCKRLSLEFISGGFQIYYHDMHEEVFRFPECHRKARKIKSNVDLLLLNEMRFSEFGHAIRGGILIVTVSRGYVFCKGAIAHYAFIRFNLPCC